MSDTCQASYKEAQLDKDGQLMPGFGDVKNWCHGGKEICYIRVKESGRKESLLDMGSREIDTREITEVIMGNSFKELCNRAGQRRGAEGAVRREIRKFFQIGEIMACFL